MYKLQTYSGHFSGFVTAWITNAGTMFAGKEREREREREVISELRILLAKT
ncbi:MAG: hypothetical protein LBD59_11935 [Prevotellaceae bacterium]|jgi:hypothetical protein|nr:hypothetical protein [Prevotellaceae bacterium]